MSILKTLGNKIKRVVSLKNVMNAVTGNYVGIVADAKRIATTKDKHSKTQASQQVIAVPDTAIIEQAAANLDARFKGNVTTAIAESKIVQDNINGTNAFLSKLWFQATWKKNKGLILGAGAVIVGLISYFAFFRKNHTSQRGRRR